MSTKIYNEVRIETHDIFDFLSKVQHSLDPIRQQLDDLLLSGMTCTVIDRYAYGLKEPTSPSATVEDIAQDVRRSWNTFQTRLKETGQTSSFRYDPHRFDLGLTKDDVTGITVGYFFCESPELTEAFLALDGVSDFHYQDQVFTDGGIRDTDPEEWKLRRQVWDRVWGDDPLSERMVMFILRDSPALTALTRLNPDDKDRVRRLARELGVNADQIALPHYTIDTPVADLLPRK